MAAEIEDQIEEKAELIQSSGGVFEIEDGSTLIFSKKSLGRFPSDGEVLTIIQAMAQGLDLAGAQAKGAEQVPQPPSFFEWFKDVVGKKSH